MRKAVFFFVFCFFCSIEAAVPTKIVANIEEIVAHHKNLPIIAIGGCPGVGKTTFAKMLSQELALRKIRCAMISFDDFGKTSEQKKTLKNELDIMRIRWDELHRVLQDIACGKKEILLPRIDQLTKERKEEVLHLEDIDVILFEGMYALANQAPMNLRSYVDLGIYMETSAENICLWKWEREKKKTAARTLEQFENHMALIFEDFVRFVYPTKRNADWVIFSDDQHEFHLSFHNANACSFSTF